MIIHSNLDFKLAEYETVPLEQEKSVFFKDKTIGWKQKFDITELDDQFEDGGAFFDLPQGDRWIADKEIVPLSGELPGMAMGLMKSLEKNKLYWRVIGRKASGQQTISEIRTFSINPVTGGKQS